MLHLDVSVTSFESGLFLSFVMQKNAIISLKNDVFNLFLMVQKIIATKASGMSKQVILTLFFLKTSIFSKSVLGHFINSSSSYRKEKQLIWN